MCDVCEPMSIGTVFYCRLHNQHNKTIGIGIVSVLEMTKENSDKAFCFQKLWLTVQWHDTV